MKFISWNVNGLRACVQKGFLDFLTSIDADYFVYRSPSYRRDRLTLTCQAITSTGITPRKKDYSGTAIFAKNEPLSVSYGIGIDEHDREGRVITLEYDNFYLVTCYTPNSQNELKRLPYRMQWEDDFREYLKDLDAQKPVVLCGDLNVAHNEIDLKNPKTNRKNAGFSDEERAKMTELLGPALPIPSDIFIRMPRVYIPGGHTVLRLARRTQAGVSTTYHIKAHQ